MKLAHIGLAVQDLERSLKFYTTVFSCQPTGRIDMEHVRIGYLEAEDFILELLQYTGENNRRTSGLYDHIALRVDNIEEEVTRLKTLGVEFLYDEPRPVPGGKLIIFCQGPDGERIELVQG